MNKDGYIPRWLHSPIYMRSRILPDLSCLAYLLLSAFNCTMTRHSPKFISIMVVERDWLHSRDDAHIFIILLNSEPSFPTTVFSRYYVAIIQ